MKAGISTFRPARPSSCPPKTLLALGGCGGWLAGGGRLKAMALKLSPEEERTLSQEELGARFGLLLFRGTDSGTSVYYSANTFRYSGMANILIPLVISALIVLNTMIGSVYERKREIAVYTSVGLAPSHVSFLFVAESLAFAVLSVVVGYLVAQAAAVVLAGTPLWAGMTANYSSLAGVGAIGAGHRRGAAFGHLPLPGGGQHRHTRRQPLLDHACGHRRHHRHHAALSNQG